MKLEFHPRRAWRTLWKPDAGPPASELKTAYVDWVEQAKAKLPHDEAMAYAIGGGFEEFGLLQASLLRRYGLRPEDHLVEVGCGSGRLAKPLSRYLTGRYLGIDLVPDLIEHARRVADRPDWRFDVINHIEIPEDDGVADMVCFFSVLTHLRQEQSFWYLEEAKRVLRPGGSILFSFLEFLEPGHMPIFWHTLRTAKARRAEPMNVFIDRVGVQRWADALALEVIDFRLGSEQIVSEGVLGQSLCVLRKPA